jgi:2'-hydroxyisoflavone reductase
MDRNRREFVKMTAVAGAGWALASALPVMAKPKPMKILILGGTSFLGPQIVEAAKARGHVLTLFNRGKTNPGLFPDIEKLRGDRDGDLKSLEGRSWDAVVDTSGFVPRIVTMSAELLAPNVKQYVFISTVSVFPPDVKPGTAEDGPLATMPDASSEDVTKYYGALKALCEKAADKAMAGRALSIRPGLIVGPGDKTDRFTYWPVRVAHGGEVLAPGDGSDPVQYVDVRDLAAWIVLGVERNLTGVYNATGPAKPLTMKKMLEGIKKGTGGDAKFTWVSTDFLEKKEIAPWSDLPVWVPGADGKEGFTRISDAKAVAAGLTFRPVASTAKDTLAWYKTLPADRRGKLLAGISLDKEKELLAAWHAAKLP